MKISKAQLKKLIESVVREQRYLDPPDDDGSEVEINLPKSHVQMGEEMARKILEMILKEFDNDLGKNKVDEDLIVEALESTDEYLNLATYLEDMLNAIDFEYLRAAQRERLQDPSRRDFFDPA